MSDDEKQAPKAEEMKTVPVVAELADDDLAEVVGGFNPQPDPPGRS